MLPRALPLLALLVASACVSNPGPHPRALENNELCAQYLVAGNLNQAEIHCDLGLQFSPQYADLHVNKGLIYLKRGEDKLAKESFVKALRYNQEQAQAYNNLGYIYLKDGKLGEAHDNFQRSLKVNPDYLEARYNLAKTYMRMEEKEKARKEYRTLLAINPNIADVHHDLCIMAQSEGALDEAINECQLAVRLDPRFEAAWVSYGVVLGEAGRFSEAADAYVACLELSPGNIECRNNLPVVRRKQGLLDPAIKEIEDQQRAGAQSPASLLLLARTYREKGLRAEEERTYRKCLKMDGRYAPCHYGLFEIFRDERRDKEAVVGCKNFVKFAVADEFPREVETCETFLRSHPN